MIDFKDFEPQLVQHGRYREEFETVRDALHRANAWLAEQADDIELIRIETVVLPNMHRRHEEGTEDPQLRTSVETTNDWYQFLRVWYNRKNDQ